MRSAKYSKVFILSVCLLLVFAVTAALLFGSGASLSEKENIIADTGEGADEVSGAFYPVSADGYTHGSNIGRATSGTNVNSASAFVSALNSNSNINITGSFTMDSSYAFSHTSTYSGTIYGNGYTITLTPNSSISTSSSSVSYGGLISTLTGKIYDLNVTVSSATYIVRKGTSGAKGSYANLGMIAGYINGGTVENCTVSMGTGEVWVYAWRKEDWASFGAIAGRATNATIKNCTITNNATIKAGPAANTDVTSVTTSSSGGTSSNCVGYYETTSNKVDNIIVEGTGSLNSYYASNLGMTSGDNTSVTTTNYYNKFTGRISSTNNGGSAQFVRFLGTGSWGSTEAKGTVNLTNMYTQTGATSVSNSYNIAPSASITVRNDLGYSIYFDPRQEDLSNSLAVVKSGVTGGENYSAAITTSSGTKYSDKYAFSDDGGTVIFRQLPTAISNWGGNGGTFNCTINITLNAIDVTPLDPVNKWESSYTTSQSSSGTAVDNGSKLTTAINNNQNICLTDDITDFSGFSHTGTYSGTLDGNGHTIYIVRGADNSTQTVGGLFGTLTGTIKNVRIVLYTSYSRTINTDKVGTGIIAGCINNGTVDNVYIYIPSNVTLSVDGGSSRESYVGAIAGFAGVSATESGADGASYTIRNTTVDIDGKMHLDGSWVYMAGFVGKSSTGASAATANIISSVFKGKGNFSSSKSDSAEPIYLAATTVLFQKATDNSQSTININGFINAFKGGETNLTGGYSMYGVLSKNDNSGTMSKWTKNVSGVYDCDSPMADVNKKTGTGNNFIDVSENRYTVSVTVKGSSIKVIPYFPAGDTTNLVLVAGDGSTSVPDLVYGEYSSTADDNYKVVTVPKTAIASDVTLSEPVIPAEPIDDLNKWENAYTTESSSDGIPVASGAELEAAIAANENIYLADDVLDFVGFGHTSTYSGTLDGNGHTIYIVKTSAASGNNIGGLFSMLTGTVKNVRIVVMDGVDLSGTNYVGGVAGVLSESATVSNVNVIINEGVTLAATNSGNNAGGAGGIAGAVINGATTVTINNSTVELNGTLKATAQWTFVAGFVGHLNGGTVNFRDITFKGSGMLDGAVRSTEGVHTAGAAIIGGGVEVVSLDGMINGFTGTKTANKSAYAITFVKNGSTTPTFANIYTYGGDFSNEGGMEFGTPVDISSAKSQISATVADTSVPVKAYFPINNNGKLVLVAGDGTSECQFVTYQSYEGVQDGNYMVVSIPKTEITAHSNVQLIQGKSPVNEPTLATTEEELVYKGGEITVAINQLMSGTTDLGEGDYTIAVTANGGNALVQNGKPLNAGEYTLTVTLLNDYEFEDGTMEKTIAFTVTPFVISGSLAVSGSEVYDKTEKTVIFTADENKGLFNGDNVVISYNDGDRVNVTEAGFTATATVPNDNYTFADGNEISADFKITAKELTVVWGETSFTYDGSEKAPTAEVTEGVLEGDELTIAVSGAVVAAGQDYTATATITPESANYTLTNNTISFSIAKAKVSVSGKDVIVEYKAAEYTEEEIKAAVFADGLPDGVTTTIKVSPESVLNAGESATVTVALVDGDNCEFEAGATTQFTFSVTAKEISLPAESANKSVVYSKSTSYTAAQIAELIFGTASVENVTVKVMSGDVEISGDTVVSDAGVYTVTAEANANYVFAEGTTTEYTFEITKAPIILSVSVNGWTYGNAANDPHITGNDGSGTVTYLYTGDGYSNEAAPTDAGKYSLEITVEETTNYQGGKASCQFTIEKAAVTVPTIEDKVYTGDILTADVSNTDEYDVVKNDGGSEVATYEVVLRLKDANNYKWSDGTETAEITLEFHIVASGNSWNTVPSIIGWTYGQYSAETNAPDYEAEKGNDTAVVEFKLASEEDSTYRIVKDLSTLDAGAYNMRVRVPETEDYGGLSKVVEFTVEKASLTVSVSIDGWTYGEKAKAPVISGNKGGKETYSYEGIGDTVYAASEEVPVNAGTYRVTVTVAETENYFGATAEAEFTIAQKAVTATVTAENATYDGAEHAATVSFDGKVGEDELIANLLYNGKAVVPVDAGRYTVTVQSYGGAAAANYDITTAEREVVLKISPKELNYGDFDVKYEDVNFDGVYDGKPHGAVATIKDGVLIGDDTLTVTVLYDGSEKKPVNAGEYKISLKISGNDNYVMGEDNSAEFVIKKATVKVNGANATAVYTGEAFTEKQIISAVFKDADLSLVNVKVTFGNGVNVVNAGETATVTVTGCVDGNYTLAPDAVKEYTFTVTTAKVDAPELVQDSYEYNGEEITVSLKDPVNVGITGNVKTDAGNYTATVALADKSNYEWVSGGSEDVQLSWSITAKNVTLKAETSVEKVYDGEGYDFSGYTVSGIEGFYERDSVTVSVSAGEIFTPGSYGIEVNHNANDNYNVTVESTDAQLTIGKAKLVINAKNAEIEYNGKAIEFEFSIEGVVGEDEVSIGKVVYKRNGIEVTPMEIGAYVAEFTLAGAQADYYTADTVNVSVTAPTTEAPEGMKAENIITPEGEIVYDGKEHNATLNYDKAEGDLNTYGLIYYLDGNPVESVVNAGVYTVRVYKNSSIYLIEGIEKQIVVLPEEITVDEITVYEITTEGLIFTYSGGKNTVTATAKGVNGENVTLVVMYDGEETAPVNAGKYTVTFRSDNGNYVVAEGVSFEMTVKRKPINKPVAPQLTYNGKELIAFADTEEYTVSGIFKATDVSAENYTAVFTLISENYKWSNEADELRKISVSWNITPAEVVIGESGAEKSKTYDGNALTDDELRSLFTAPDKIGGGKVEINVAVNGGVEVRDAGEYTITATVNDINYASAEISVTYKVTKADPTVSAVVQDKLMQEGDKLSTVGISLGEDSTAGEIVWDEPDRLLEKGENVVTWSFIPADGNNYNGASGSVTLTVGDEKLTAFEIVEEESSYKTEYVAFEDFDGSGIVLKATFDGMYEQKVTLAECEIEIENATADGKMSGATTVVTIRYGNLSVQINVTVEKIKVSVPVPEKSVFEYNSEAQTVIFPESGLYNVVGGDTQTNVGKHNAEIALADTVNYVWEDGTAENKTVKWEITPVTLSGEITLPENLVYDGNAKTATFTLTQGTLYGGAKMTITYELTDGTVLAGAPVDAGVYEVVATLPDSNYQFAEGTEYSKAMTIEKKTVEIVTIGSREKVYDGKEVTAAQLAEHFSVSGGITVKVTVSGTVLNAGTYSITAEIDEKNYRAEPVTCTYTVRKAERSISASLSVGYRQVEIAVDGANEGVEYSLDGNVWQTLNGAIAVELQAKYAYYVRYAESANYNASPAVKVEANITKAALATYADERFGDKITLKDAADIAWLETLASAADGENAEFDERMAQLSAERERLVNGATAAVEKALKAGGALRGYAGAVAAVALTLGGVSVAAALGLCIKNRKGGKKNEEK